MLGSPKSFLSFKDTRCVFEQMVEEVFMLDVCKVLDSRKCEILRKLGFLKKKRRNQGQTEWGAS